MSIALHQLPSLDLVRGFVAVGRRMSITLAADELCVSQSAVSRQIRALPLNATTPIIAITANACEQDRQTCLAAGMSDFLTKPVSPERLYSAARRWLMPASAHVTG